MTNNQIYNTLQDCSQRSNFIQQVISDDILIYVDIYDREGKLTEADAGGRTAENEKSGRSVLGIDLFEHHFLTEEMKLRLRAGANMRFTIDYWDISIKVMRGDSGEINTYMVISQNISEYIQLQKKYEILYNQNMTILNSLPVGVGVYSKEGTLIYSNDVNCRIFGVDLKKMVKPVNINDNPSIPDKVKEAIRSGIPLHLQFPYDFGVGPNEYYPTFNAGIRQIECNGRPVINEGNIDHYVFIWEDVTEATLKEQESRENKRKVEIAMNVADIMLWEFDVEKRLFYSENDPVNGCDSSTPITIDLYRTAIHPDEREMLVGLMQRVVQGENFSFDFNMQLLFPGNPEWQYCSVVGSPYEIGENGKVTKYVGSRKNNTELRKKELLQEKILNSIPLPIHIKDVEDNFRYIFCNEESNQMFGIGEGGSYSDLMDKEIIELVHKTDIEVFKTEKPYLGLERIVLKDGHSYDTIVRKSVIHDGDKRLLLSVYWDQSLQNDLMRRSKLFTLTLEAMKAFTWFFEPDKGRVSFGEGFDKIGRKASEINTLEAFLECVHPDDRGAYVSSLKDVFDEMVPVWDIVCRVDLDGDGVYEWWEARGVLETSVINGVVNKYMFGMTVSCESHKQIEQMLLKKKEELIRQNELIMNNANSGLAYINKDYIVQWENISICTASLSYEAYKKGEYCYKSAHNRTSPCENCVLQRAFQSRQMEQIKFNLDNDHIVEIFATPIYDTSNVLDGIVIRVDDITERERMIAELQHAKALAERSDKLKSAFLANMSHEIRTPLNAIVGFSDLLANSTEEEEKAQYVQIINNNNELLLKLINDILDISKIEAGFVEFKYEEFDLSDYFNDIYESMKQRIIKPDVRLKIVNPYPSCFVRLDKNRVAQIISNYVTNAIKYTPKGYIEMGYECSVEGVRFYVKDTGIGIPEEKKNKVFHRFEKLDEFAQGTGLGLSICKAIAESMGGSVGFESQNGEGSFFWAQLPCELDFLLQPIVQNERMVSGQSVDIQSAALIPVNLTPGMKTILIAEDIDSNYILLLSLLQKKYNLIRAYNGQQAVEFVKNQPIDFVLMDMKMPVMDGLTATAEIRKLNMSIPVVALTAHAFENDRLAALAAGCNDYLVKPLNKNQLFLVLQKYCPVFSCNQPESSRTEP